MAYFTKYDYTIIRKHWLILLLKYLKAMVFLLLAFILFKITIYFRVQLGDEIVHFLLFPIIFILINYAFIYLLLGYIRFYNDLLIIHDGQLIVIKTSLLFKDNIEFIDINKVTKLDTYCKGLIPNIFGFGNLVVEQQRDEVREFHFIPDLFKALNLLKEEKNRTIEGSKNNKN